MSMQEADAQRVGLDEEVSKDLAVVEEEDQGSYEAAVEAMKSMPVILPPRPVPMPALRPRPPVVSEGHFAARAARPLPFSAKVSLFGLEEQNERQDVLLAEQRQRTGLIVALMSQYVNFAPDVQSAEDAFREAVQREEEREVMLLVEDYIGSHQQALIHTLERLQLQGESLYAEAMSLPPLIAQDEEYELAQILHWHKVHRPYHYCKKTGKKFDMVKRLDENSPTRRNLATFLIPAPPTDMLPFARAEGRRSWGKEKESQFERKKREMTLVDWMNEEALDRMEMEADWMRGVLQAEGSEYELRRRLENPSPRAIRSQPTHISAIEDVAPIEATQVVDTTAAAIRIQCCGRQYLSKVEVQRRLNDSRNASESRVGSERVEEAASNPSSPGDAPVAMSESIEAPQPDVFSKAREDATSHTSRGGSANSNVSASSEAIRRNLQHAIATSKDLTPLELLLAVGEGPYPGIEALINALGDADTSVSVAPNALAASDANNAAEGDAAVPQVPHSTELLASPPAEVIDEDIIVYTNMDAAVVSTVTPTTPLVGIEMLARSLKSMDAGYGGGGTRSGASLPLSCTPMAGPWKPVLQIAGMMVGLVTEDKLIPAPTCTRAQVQAHPSTTALLLEAGDAPGPIVFSQFASQTALQQCPVNRERRRLLETKPFSRQLVSSVIFNTHAHTFYGQFLLEGCRWEVYSTDPDVERTELEGEELAYVFRNEQADRERIIVDQIGGIMDLWALHYVMRSRSKGVLTTAPIEEEEEEEL